MAKTRTFAAKVAHASKEKGHQICPKCNSEIRVIKVIRSKPGAKGKWVPKQEMIKVCKCNEKEILAGNI
jgi:hypothetical protein